MENPNEKSLKIIKEPIFAQIKRFINQILKKKNEQIEIKEESINTNSPKEEFIQRINNNVEDTADLIRKIETKEIKVEEQKDEELEQINANLTRYLQKIQKEIDRNITEKNMYEMQIKSYKKQLSNE